MKLSWTRRRFGGDMITLVELNEKELETLIGFKSEKARKNIIKKISEFYERNKQYFKHEKTNNRPS